MTRPARKPETGTGGGGVTLFYHYEESTNFYNFELIFLQDTSKYYSNKK